jgi:2',3'-cyclic-nucleotide 2'-phosphodiesterase (5'-nucleotidase family)
VAYIKSQQAAVKGQLVVDAGNLLLDRKGGWRPKAAPAPEALARWKTRAEQIARVYQLMGVKGVAVGALDLVLGVPTLKALSAQHGLPLLSANLRSLQGERLFPASAVVMVGGIKVGIFGLTGDHGVFRDAIDRTAVQVGDLAPAIAEQVKALRGEGAQVVVALAAVGFAAAKALGESLKGVDFVIVSGTSRSVEALEKVGDAWVMESGAEGKSLGELKLHVKAGGAPTFEDLSERLILAKQIEQMRKNLGKIQAHAGGTDGTSDLAQRRLEGLERSLDRLKVRLHSANQKQPPGSFCTNVLVTMELSLPDDQEAAALLAPAAPPG